MLSLLGILAPLLGPPAIKAVAAGIGGAVATNVAVVAANGCAPADVWMHLWTTAGGFIIPHAVTWLSPKNRG